VDVELAVALFLSGAFYFILFWFFSLQGVVDEFRIPNLEDPTLEQFQYSWRFGNGMFGLVLTFGLLWTAVKSRKARSWLYGSGTSLNIIS
jgi:hypothetical protein